MKPSRIRVLFLIVIFLLSPTIFASSKENSLGKKQLTLRVKESCKPDLSITLTIFEEHDKQYISFNEVIEKYFQDEENIADFLKKYMLSDGKNLRYAIKNQMLQLEPLGTKLFLISKHFVNSGDGN